MDTPQDEDPRAGADETDRRTKDLTQQDSILDRIQEATGSRPDVSLRDEAGAASVADRFGAEGDRVAGKYIIEDELGRGGVGAVCRGRDQELGRVVAMKFLHERYQAEPTILHRFVEEAQIGGQLQHPGIVPVYDLGMRDGRPFFAMKLIKGETLAQRLAERAQTAEHRREVLDVFESVCQTMAYAHARGVVHRDLKPANIMIGAFGEVQVVDWGMAKVLTQTGAEAASPPDGEGPHMSALETLRSAGEGPQSLAGSVMGTPAYMPPEQALGDVEAMDERSDVFALGAILCEILTGQPPYTGEPDELLAQAAMARLDDANARLDACTDEPEMADLAKRCLIRAPAARPRSAEAVAKAVHDHLAAVELRVHEARVEAAEAKVKADSLRKMQRLGIAFTTVIAAALVVSLWLWDAASAAAESERQAKVAAEASERIAKTNEQRAVEIKTLIREMLLSVTPERALGADTTLMRGILQDAAERITGGEVDDEVVAAELRALIGEVLSSLGEFEDAERHLRVAYDARQRLLGAEHPETLATGMSLASALLYNVRIAEAEALGEKVLAARRRVLGPTHRDTLGSMSNLAGTFERQGRLDEAIELYEDVLATCLQELGPEDDYTLATQASLGLARLNNDDVAAGTEMLQQALRASRRAAGASSPIAIQVQLLLARARNKAGDLPGAESLWREAVGLARETFREDHPITLTATHDLAFVLARLSKHEEAETLARRALTGLTGRLGADHERSLVATQTLAQVLIERGGDSIGEAQALLEAALPRFERQLGAADRLTIEAKTGLAGMLLNSGRVRDAEALLVEVIDSYRESARPADRSYVSATEALAGVRMQSRRFAEAADLHDEAYQFRLKSLGPDHMLTLGSSTNLAAALHAQGRFAESAALLERSVEGKLRVLGRGHPWTLSAQMLLASCYDELGRPAEALEVRREHLETTLLPALSPSARPEDCFSAARSLLTHPSAELHDPERALGFAQRALELEEQRGGTDRWRCLEIIAIAQHALGDTEAAVATMRRALEALPEGAPDAALLRQRLSTYEASLKR